MLPMFVCTLHKCMFDPHFTSVRFLQPRHQILKDPAAKLRRLFLFVQLFFVCSMRLLRNNVVKLHSSPYVVPGRFPFRGSDQSTRLLLDTTFDLRLVPLSNISPQQLLPPAPLCLHHLLPLFLRRIKEREQSL